MRCDTVTTCEDIDHAIRWLLDRLPPELHAGLASSLDVLQWEVEDRALTILFETPHRVLCRRDAGHRFHSQRKLNVAMNVDEIVDLVRWCHDGRDRTAPRRSA